MGSMEVITPFRTPGRASVVPLLPGTVVGTLLIVSGITLAYLVFATPLLGTLVPTGQLSIGEMATGMTVWALALVAPAGFLLAGANRLARIIATVRGRRPRRSLILRGLDTLPPTVTVASGLHLPDGRPLSDLVLGSFGAAIIRELPSARVTRIRDGRWEARSSHGWVSLENPLERATRDAERVRHWLTQDDADHVVKVYAAVVSPEPTVARTATCAVLKPDQLGAWITALPPQRSLTDGRLQRIIETVRGASGRG
jgi:hypothetical protein